MNVPQILDTAVRLHQSGKLAQAALHYIAVLKAQPKQFDALHLLGVLRSQQGHHAEALDKIRLALKLNPLSAEAWANLGLVHSKLGTLKDALASYDRVLAIRPDHVETFANRGAVLRQLKRPSEALASYEKALAINPENAETLYNRGNLLRDIRRFEEALASYDKALAVKPDDPETFYNRGNVLRQLNRQEEALASYEELISLRPKFPDALYNRGNVLRDLKRFEEALESYDKALTIKPDYAEALNNRGNALRDLKRPAEALASYDKALAIKQDYADALNNYGSALVDLGRIDEALASYGKALALRPDHQYALAGVADCAIKACDWARAAKTSRDLTTYVTTGKSTIPPFILLGYSDDPALHLQCARTYIQDRIPQLPPPLTVGRTGQHQKVRIAYLSADFRRHPVSYLTAELFELHDRARFEVLGISFGADDHSDIRSRVVASFDQFHDVERASDHQVARLLREFEVDIAIDLTGYTQNARPEILACRPAPVQVSYLGYPGTMAAEFIDYIIADNIVLPFDQQSFYSENIVHLPECYLVSDAKKLIPADMPTRRDAGLPDLSFVFCCFNNSWKITAPFFDVWMRLLNAVEGSVLWLLRNPIAEINLQNEAVARGVDARRLIFAERIPFDEHLARHRLADLFLDTLPYNAHTTGSDALWMGLPLLTCHGMSFAGRVGASLLTACGLSELIAENLSEYEALALKLASDPLFHQTIRRKLAANRPAYPLFDTARFCRHIEAAYLTMWEIAQRGDRPRSFAVEKAGIH